MTLAAALSLDAEAWQDTEAWHSAQGKQILNPGNHLTHPSRGFLSKKQPAYCKELSLVCSHIASRKDKSYMPLCRFL
jgi:hypothetical protein